MIQGDDIFINSDDETNCEFSFIEKTVQANPLAATTIDTDARNQVYNPSVDDRATLNQ